MQILLPGETPQPGATTGKTAGSSPTSVIVGEPYAVTVRLTDNWFNAVGFGAQGSGVKLATNDPYDPTNPDTKPIVRGPKPGDLHLNL